MIACGVNLRILSCLLVAMNLAGAEAPPRRIAVSANHRFLQYDDGAPFFWLGDTACNCSSSWIARRPSGISTIASRRASRGTGGGVAEYRCEERFRRDGAGGAECGDAEHRGGLLGPRGLGGGPGSEARDFRGDAAGVGVGGRRGELNAGNVAEYGKFLARRYRDKPNIIWVLGGDTRGDQQTEVWNALGRAIKGEDPKHLMTYHPFGRMQSSTWFHDELWLDFNMFQSGHQRYDQDKDSPRRYGEDNWRYVRDDYARTPVKPVLDGEPSYENIPQGLHDTSQPYWSDADARRYAYWSVFAGSFGHTYGDQCGVSVS